MSVSNGLRLAALAVAVALAGAVAARAARYGAACDTVVLSTSQRFWPRRVVCHGSPRSQQAKVRREEMVRLHRSPDRKPPTSTGNSRPSPSLPAPSPASSPTKSRANTLPWRLPYYLYTAAQRTSRRTTVHTGSPKDSSSRFLLHHRAHQCWLQSLFFRPSCQQHQILIDHHPAIPFANYSFRRAPYDHSGCPTLCVFALCKGWALTIQRRTLNSSPQVS